MAPTYIIVLLERKNKMSGKENNQTTYFTALDFRELAEGNLDEVKENAIVNKCLMAKLISNIRFEVASCSLAGISNCNVSVNYSTVPVPRDLLPNIMKYLKDYFEDDKFEVSIGENMISLDWSKEGPYGDISDEYDDAENYENMHKQKNKKQHAPRKHNLKVVK